MTGDGPFRIAHVTATFPPYWAGTGNVAYHNARLLHERGHQLTVFTASTPRDHELEFPYEVAHLRTCFRIGNAPFTPSLMRQLSGFDLIHLHYPLIFGGELTALAARRHRIPLLMTYHNDLLAPGLRGALFALYARTSQPWLLRRADRLLATSEDYARHSLLARTAPDLEQIGVAANGVDTDTFHPNEEPPAWRDHLGIPEGEPAALFVGGLDPAHHFKGVHVLLDAMSRLPHSHLVVVGDGGPPGPLRGRGRAQLPGPDSLRWQGSPSAAHRLLPGC